MPYFDKLHIFPPRSTLMHEYTLFHERRSSVLTRQDIKQCYNYWIPIFSFSFVSPINTHIFWREFFIANKILGYVARLKSTWHLKIIYKTKYAELYIEYIILDYLGIPKLKKSYTIFYNFYKLYFFVFHIRSCKHINHSKSCKTYFTNSK